MRGPRDEHREDGDVNADACDQRVQHAAGLDDVEVGARQMH